MVQRRGGALKMASTLAQSSRFRDISGNERCLLPSNCGIRSIDLGCHTGRDGLDTPRTYFCKHQVQTRWCCSKEHRTVLPRVQLLQGCDCCHALPLLQTSADCFLHWSDVLSTYSRIASGYS